MAEHPRRIIEKIITRARPNGHISKRKWNQHNNIDKIFEVGHLEEKSRLAKVRLEFENGFVFIYEADEWEYS